MIVVGGALKDAFRAVGVPKASFGAWGWPAELFLSEATVKTHITRAFAKIDVANRVQLTIFAYEAGVVTP